MSNSHLPLVFEDETVHRRRWFLLAILCLALVLVVMSVAGLNVALAEMQIALGATAAELQWFVDSYTIIFGGMLLTAGALGDRFGRKWALQGGLGLFAFGSLLAVMAQDSAGIVVSRGIMGLGAAFVMPSTLSLISNIFAPGERAKAIAIWAGFAGAGAALGGVLTGLFMTGWWFIPNFGWESAFLYPLFILVVVVVCVWVWMPHSKDETATPLDPVGAVLSIVGVIALLYGIIEGAAKGWTEPSIIAAFVIATVTLYAFVYWEKRNGNAMLPMWLFRDRRFSLGSGVLALTFFALLGFFFLFPLYTQYVLGYSPLAAGLATVPMALTQLFVAAPTTSLTARFGPSRVMLGGLILLMVSFAGLKLAEVSGSYLVFLLPLLGLGAGMALAMVPATNQIMAATPIDRAGIGSAVNDAARELGSALGIAVLGSVAVIAYRAALDLTTLPEQVRIASGESIGAAVGAISELPYDQAEGALTNAQAAFSGAFGFTMMVSALAALTVAVVIVAWGQDETTRPSEAPASAD